MTEQDIDGVGAEVIGAKEEVANAGAIHREGLIDSWLGLA